jgi:hypothetical protein
MFYARSKMADLLKQSGVSALYTRPFPSDDLPFSLNVHDKARRAGTQYQPVDNFRAPESEYSPRLRLLSIR